MNRPAATSRPGPSSRIPWATGCGNRGRHRFRLGRAKDAEDARSVLLDDPADNTNPQYAFSVVQYGSATVGNVVAHELGHVLGLDHTPVAADVMAEQLAVGERYLPTAADLAAAGMKVSTRVEAGVMGYQPTTVTPAMARYAPRHPSASMPQAASGGPRRLPTPMPDTAMPEARTRRRSRP